jgi:hypothetical protein
MQPAADVTNLHYWLTSYSFYSIMLLTMTGQIYTIVGKLRETSGKSFYTSQAVL